MRASEGGVVLVCIRLLFARSLPTSGLKLLHYKFRVSFYDAGVLITDGSSALGTRHSTEYLAVCLSTNAY